MIRRELFKALYNPIHFDSFLLFVLILGKVSLTGKVNWITLSLCER